MKKIFLLTILIFTLSTSLFSKTLSFLDSSKIASVGYSFVNENSDNFVIIQKIKKDKNSKIIAFWNKSNLNVKDISTALVKENSKNFKVQNKFKVQNANVVKYTSGNNKNIVHIYDILFPSKINSNIFITINFSAKVTLNNKEIVSLMKEAETFLK